MAKEEKMPLQKPRSHDVEVTLLNETVFVVSTMPVSHHENLQACYGGR